MRSHCRADARSSAEQWLLFALGKTSAAVPVPGRIHSGQLVKLFVEKSFVAVAHHPHDFLHGDAGFLKILLCLFNPKVDQVIGIGHSELFFDQLIKVIGLVVKFPGEFLHGHGLQIVFHKIRDRFKESLGILLIFLPGEIIAIAGGKGIHEPDQKTAADVLISRLFADHFRDDIVQIVLDHAALFFGGGDKAQVMLLITAF